MLKRVLSVEMAGVLRLRLLGCRGGRSVEVAESTEMAGVLRWLGCRSGWCFEVAKVSWLFECRSGWGVEVDGV
jgi:hypothetical protein